MRKYIDQSVQPRDRLGVKGEKALLHRDACALQRHFGASSNYFHRVMQYMDSTLEDPPWLRKAVDTKSAKNVNKANAIICAI